MGVVGYKVGADGIAVGEGPFVLHVVELQAEEPGRIERGEDGFDQAAVHPTQQPEASGLGEQAGRSLADIVVVLDLVQRRKIHTRDIHHPAEHTPSLTVDFRQRDLSNVSPYECPSQGFHQAREPGLFGHGPEEGALTGEKVLLMVFAAVICVCDMPCVLMLGQVAVVVRADVYHLVQGRQCEPTPGVAS